LPEELLCFLAPLIPPDDDDDGAQDERPRATPVTTGAAADKAPTGTATLDATEHDTSVPVEFDLDDLPPIDDDDMIAQVDRHSQDLPARLLHWHYRMGHLSFKKLQVMAEQGTIHKALATCRLPQCSACLYGKATKRAWRTRATPNRLAPATITGPGDCISVDQLESSTPGLIAQLRGFLTRQRYSTVSTIFVDHFSCLSYVHLQRSTSADDTLQAKRAFEAYATSKGVVVKH
jgi:hypothetical protein